MAMKTRVLMMAMDSNKGGSQIVGATSIPSDAARTRAAGAELCGDGKGDTGKGIRERRDSLRVEW
jgi:hypothetical protein